MIPIDIVLLPSEEIQNLAIEINQKSKVAGNFTEPLGKEDYVPHITLILGLVEEKDLSEIIRIVKDVSKKYSSFNLSIKSIVSGKSDNSYFEIEKTEKIQELHEDITNQIKKFLKKGVKKEMLYKYEETDMGENTEKWINTMVDSSTYENYNPHITLRCEKIDFENFPVAFKSTEIAVFHLGDGCTCGKLIKKFELK